MHAEREIRSRMHGKSRIAETEEGTLKLQEMLSRVVWHVGQGQVILLDSASSRVVESRVEDGVRGRSFQEDHAKRLCPRQWQDSV